MSRHRDVRQELDAAIAARLVYPGTGVMLNKLGLTDDYSLKIAERAFTSQRAAEGLPPDAKAQSYDGVKAIHRHLFQDVYEWAGKPREYTTRRSDVAAFASPVELQWRMDTMFRNFHDQGQLKGLAPAEFAERAAAFVSTLNAIHPFNDGNGRSQRAWLANVADAAGFQFDVKSNERTAWHDVSRIAFETRDTGPIAAFIHRAIEAPERTVRGPGEDRAEAFLTLTRAQAVATGDPALRIAWQNLDTVQRAATSARPGDPALATKMVETARQQIAEQFRQGREIVPVAVDAVKTPRAPDRER